MTFAVRPLRRLLPRAFPLALLLAVVGCGGGGLNCGSGCANAYDYPQTAASVPNGTAPVDDGVRLRMTQAGLDFITANLRPILAQAFQTDAQGRFFITTTTAFDAGPFSLGQGVIETHPTEIFIDADALVNSLEVTLVDAENGVRVRAEDVPIGFDGRIFTDFGLGDAACDIFGTNSAYGGRPFLTGVTLDLTLRPRVGRGAECDEAGGVGECLKIDVAVNDVVLDPRDTLGASAIELTKPAQTGCSNDGLGPCSEECSDTVFLVDPNGDNECTAVCFVEDLAVDAIFAVFGFIEDLIGGLLPNVVETALRTALEDVDGAPLSFSQRQDIAGFAPGVLPASALDLGIAIAPTSGAFDVNTPAGGALGIDVILKSGFEAAPPVDASEGLTVPHPCARPIEGVNFANLYGGAEFEVPGAIDALTGNFDGSTYHLGASLAKPAVNQLLFGLYNTGALCLEIDSDAVNTLAGGSFQLSAATLDLLTSGKLKQFADADAPAVVVVNPSQPPVVTYGAGTADEGHLIINWPDVEVGFYVLMFERFSRVFAVSADISLQIAVFDDPETQTLRISVVDGPNVTGFEETYNELIPGVDFTEVLEQLISVAFDAALGDGLEFNFNIADALSGALGVPIFIDLSGIETVPANDRQFLNVYLTMTSTPPQPRTARATSVTLAREPGVLRRVDDGLFGRPRVQATGQVSLDVDDAGDDREFFARVDFGAWRGPLRASGGTLVVRDGKLRAAGEHSITVRGRTRGVTGSLEPDGNIVTVWVDGTAPVARLQRVGDALVATGTDDATASRGLVWSWQQDDGAWTAFTTTASLALDDLAARRVSVRAQDLAGNVSRVVSLDVGTERRRLIDEREAGSFAAGGGCASTEASSSTWALALVALALWRRRR